MTISDDGIIQLWTTENVSEWNGTNLVWDTAIKHKATKPVFPFHVDVSEHTVAMTKFSSPTTITTLIITFTAC